MSFDVAFNSLVITDEFTVDFLMKRRLTGWEPSLVEVPGMDGALYAGSRAKPTEITMRLLPIQTDREERQEALRGLSRMLAVSEPMILTLSDEGGLYRKAVPKGEIEIEPYLDADAVEVTFVCPDPRLYGSSTTKSLSSTLSVTVSGTAPTRPIFSGSSIRPNSSGVWKVRETSSGRYMQVAMTAGSNHSLLIDCENRIVKVDNSVTMLTPDSDWFEWSMGTFGLSLDSGSGTVSVSWREMWW